MSDVSGKCHWTKHIDKCIHNLCVVWLDVQVHLYKMCKLTTDDQFINFEYVYLLLYVCCNQNQEVEILGGTPNVNKYSEGTVCWRKLHVLMFIRPYSKI